jgi:tRNA pseudouridine38-40 synthase
MDHLGFRIAYDGKDFSGFQLQPNLKTVQLEIEKALEIVFQHKPMRIQFTSRTDSGVHAYDQWAMLKGQFDKLSESKFKDGSQLKHSLNGVLPASIRVWDVVRIKDEFHPHRSVEWKEYQYQVLNGRITDPLLESSAWWVRSPLDINRMRAALKDIMGTHDFSAFAKQSGAARHDNTRTILEAVIQVKAHPHMKDIKVISFRFRGDGFLHNMVRALVGTLIKVGKLDDVSIKKILKSKDRSEAGRNAPANALILAKTKVDRSYYRSV